VRSIAEFAVAAGLLTLIPGPDTLLTLRTAIAAGRGQALAAAAGVCSALLGWGCAAGLGLTAALAASPDLYLALRWAGAAYLTWLGARAVVAGGRWPASGEAAQPAAGRPWRFYLRGLATCASNPKVGIFYVALFPGFIPAGGHVLADSILLAAIHSGETMTWLIVVTVLASRLGLLLRRHTARRWADRLSGAIFVAFAARLAAGG
jgi:threonine/homoserine/homoserine lactone efflux protein